MTRRLCFVGLLAACLPVIARGEADYVDPNALHDAQLVKYWQLQLPLEPDQVVTDAYLVEDQLYFGTADGYVYVVDAFTGALRWVRPIARGTYRVRQPGVSQDRVIFVTPVDMQIYGKRTGTPVLRRQLRFPAGTGTITDDRRYFIGGLDTRIYAFDLDTGYVDWRAVTGGPIYSRPAILRGQLFVANDAGRVYACLREDKRFLWQASAMGPISADLVANDNGVYAACRDHSLYLFDLGFGRVVWRVRLGSPLHEMPFVKEDVVYQFCEADGVVAIETGLPHEVESRIRWRLPSGQRVLADDDRFAYILSRDSELLVVRKTDGEVVRRAPVPGFDHGISSPDVVAGYLYNPDGQVFCVRRQGADIPTREDVLAALVPGTADAQADAAEEEEADPLPEPQDPLAADRPGVPIGGKSKISKEFGRDGD